MATILKEGCVRSCSHCETRFSFLPSEVQLSKVDVPAGYSPEEEAYQKSVFTVACPKCSAPVDVSTALGSEGKRAAEERVQQSRLREDHDL
jgi:hypothetical protein